MPELPQVLQLALEDVRAAQGVDPNDRLATAVERLITMTARLCFEVFPPKVIIDGEVIEDPEIDPEVADNLNQIIEAIRESVPKKYWPQLVRRLQS